MYVAVCLPFNQIVIKVMHIYSFLSVMQESQQQVNSFIFSMRA